MLTVIAKGEQRLLHASSLIALAAYAAQLRFLDKPSGKAERSESNDTCINSCVPSVASDQRSSGRALAVSQPWLQRYNFYFN